MYVYVLNYLLLLVWGCIKNRKVMVTVIGLQLLCILILRSDTLGVDLENYQWEYLNFQKYSFSEILFSLRPFSNANIFLGKESGYTFFNWLVGNTGLSFHSFLQIHSSVCIISLCYFIYKNSSIPWLSFAIVIAIGAYGIMFCLLRQSLATAILFFSIPLINQQKLVKFLIVVFIAAQFHIVALSFLPLYWLSRITVNPTNFFKFLSVSALLGMLIPLLNKYIFSFFWRSYEKAYTQDNSLVYNNMFLFMLAIVVFIFFFYMYNNHEIRRSDSTLFWGMMMAIPIQIMAFSVTTFSRASIGIFFPFSAVLIASTITRKKNDQVYFFSILCFVCYFLFYVIFQLFNKSLDIVPYRFYFE